MTDLERQQEIDECRRYVYAAGTVLPLIEKAKRIAFERLMNAYRDQTGNYEPIVAELYVHTNLEREFKIKEQILQTLQENK